LLSESDPNVVQVLPFAISRQSTRFHQNRFSSCWEIDKQTNRSTDRCRWSYNLLGGLTSYSTTQWHVIIQQTSNELDKLQTWAKSCRWFSLFAYFLFLQTVEYDFARWARGTCPKSDSAWLHPNCRGSNVNYTLRKHTELRLTGAHLTAVMGLTGVLKTP